jgi:hypothetical protein
VWADRRFTLGGGRAFAVYVAGYTLGRTWIELLQIDPANHFFGLRINVFTSVLVFVGAIAFLILRRNVPREDPALVRGPDRRGPDRRGDSGVPDSPPAADSGRHPVATGSDGGSPDPADPGGTGADEPADTEAATDHGELTGDQRPAARE